MNPVPEPAAPSEATIQAWLEGELSEDEATVVERYFDEHPDRTSGDRPEAIDMGAFDIGPPEPHVLELIDMVKTKHAPDIEPPSEDAWREVLSPSDNPLHLGRLGDYEVIDLIATGGMGILLRGRDPKLDRVAALKVLSPDLANNKTARERFLREARAAARLEHENILPIYGVHEESIPYFSMRYVAGGSLQDALDSGRNLTLDELKSIGRQVASALGSAHASGIVHRDIKPANILLDADGETVWVCDFGIARTLEDPSLTYAGTISGTPQYMSPEQATSGDFDGRSDLFSLGAVLYRCATGQLAFAGKTSASVLHNVATADPERATQFNRKLPAWFERLLGNLLAKKPDDRFATADEVVRAIDDEHAPRPRYRVRRRRLLLACAAGIVALLGLSQIPAFRSGASLAISSSFDKPFRIEGGLGAYESLPHAVASARSGDTIFLPAGEPIAIDLLEIPANKELTLRAAPGSTSRPRLTTANLGTTGIISHSHLSLIGLDFSLKPKTDSNGIVKLIGAGGTIDDCTFFGRRHTNPGLSGQKSRVIELHGGGLLEIKGGKIDVEQSDAIALFDVGTDSTPARVAISDCSIVSFNGCSLNGFRADGRTVEIDILRSLFTGHYFLKGFTREIPKTTLNADHCVFDTGRSFVWFLTDKKKAVENRFRFTGKKLRHTLGKARLMISSTEEFGETLALLSLDSPPLSLSDWTPPKSAIGWIQIEGKDRRFTSLDRACSAAGNNDTLLLSGDIICSETVTTPVLRKLNFRRAPVGLPPTIIFADPVSIGLALRAPATFDAINFLRPIATDTTQGLSLVVVAHSGPFHFKRCRFEQTPTRWQQSSGVGLGMINAEQVTVQQCCFHIPGGAALLIDYTPKNPVIDLLSDQVTRTRLEIGDSMLSSALVLFHRSLVNDTKTTVIARRCAFVGDRLLTESYNASGHSVEFEFSDNLIDLDQCYFEIPQENLHAFSDNLKWTGSGNQYRPDTPIFAATRHQVPLPRQPEEFAKFKIGNFLSEFQGASDSQPVIGPLLNRKQLRHPIAPAGLGALLPKQLECGARATLKLLSQL